MSFNPVIPFGGLSGWAFLNRTEEAQKTAFAQSSATKRDTDYFQEMIPKIQSTEELVDDRRLLSVALGAFGLEDDIDSKFFVKRLLDDGTTDPSALSNVLADTRYQEFVAAFTGIDRVLNPSGFAEQITSRYLDQSFEKSVGEQNNDFRLALNIERTFDAIGSRQVGNDTKWFSILGNPPLRSVFETALRLPSSVGSVPIDDQLEIFKERAKATFGTSDVSELAAPDKTEDIVRSFLLQAQISESASLTSGATALTLLQNIRPLG